MAQILIKIFAVALLLNLAYELLHSRLYKTCREASLKKYLYLMARACLFDGIAITAIFYISYAISRQFYVIIFSITSLAFAYFWEIHSLKKGKWEYAKEMPVVFNVGLTPFVQLLVTGIFTFYIMRV